MNIENENVALVPIKATRNEEKYSHPMVAATRKCNSVQSQTCCSDEIDVCNRDENSACVKILYLKNLVQNQLKFYFYEI